MLNHFRLLSDCDPICFVPTYGSFYTVFSVGKETSQRRPLMTYFLLHYPLHLELMYHGSLLSFCAHEYWNFIYRYFTQPNDLFLHFATFLQERQVEFLPFIVEDNKIGYIHPRYVAGRTSVFEGSVLGVVCINV